MNTKQENIKAKVNDFIKGNIINAFIVLISVAYVFYNQVIIKRTDLTLAEVLAKIGIGIIIGFMIKQAMSENGFNKGYRSDIWRSNMLSYSNACNIANPYIERVDNFYISEEIERKKNYRRVNLMNARMRYDWFFDREGNYIENPDKYNKLTRKQKRILKKCIEVKIYNLNLFSEYSIQIGADTHKEKTDKDQRKKMFFKNGSVQIISAIIGAYFVATWEKWDAGAFLTATVQIACWVACGLTQMYQNYNYIVIEKVNKLVRKKELIVKFVRGCEENKYKINPYEEPVVINEPVTPPHVETPHETHDIQPSIMITPYNGV